MIVSADKGRKRVSYEDILKKAIIVFGDKDKALNWYLSPCPAYDNLSPYHYAKNGNQEKVIKLLDKTIFAT